MPRELADGPIGCAVRGPAILSGARYRLPGVHGQALSTAQETRYKPIWEPTPERETL
jgi:hypothetical protein